MPENCYTVLIIPKKHGPAKKVTLPANIVKGVSVVVTVAFLTLMYYAYDYTQIRRDRLELTRLRHQTQEQRVQIDRLVHKVDQFSLKMDELNQVDKKIRIMANLQKGGAREQILGIGGPMGDENKIQAKLKNDERTITAELHRDVDRMTDEASNRLSSFQEILDYMREQKSILAATPSVWPVQGWITSEFGSRPSPFSDGGREFHKGIDIATRLGRAILAPADGVVTDACYQPDMGNTVRVDHGHGLSTTYAHLSKFACKPGMVVKRSMAIGYVGNTGRSTGSHLHYAVFLNGVPVNPRKYLN